MTEVDRWIISKVEAFSHWTQRWFGIRSGSWERLLLCYVLLEFLLVRIPSHLGREHAWWVSPLFDGILDGLFLLSTIHRFAASVYRDPSIRIDRAMNPKKLTEYAPRAGCLCLSVILAGMQVWFWVQYSAFPFGIWFQCSTLAAYFAACDDLPWTRARAREMLQAFWLRPQPSEAL